MQIKRPSFTFLLFFFLFATARAQSGRSVIDLSGRDWKLILDTAAAWQNDVLFVPPVDLNKLPVNSPTGGWQLLERAKARMVHLPATVEEYDWGTNGNSFGVSGNYLGVSWFVTKYLVPASLKGKRLTLNFESVRFRAEVFVNRKLVGYDLVNSTPFEVGITSAVQFGKENEIAVRITDPNGNFDWRDSQNFLWGLYRTIPSHGFGGITGKVKLLATDNNYIRDVFVKNKPDPSAIEVQVTTHHTNAGKGSIALQIKEAKGSKTIYEQEYPLEAAEGESVQTYALRVKDARLWSVDQPNLYQLTVRYKSHSSEDTFNRRFGFRWFDIKNINGDQQFFLNGKRIVLRTAISWGFWPVNGIAPNDALARKQIEDAKKLGLNMLNFHRTIGQSNVLDYADEMGLLYFEEPGGNQYPANLFTVQDSLGRMQRDFYFACRNEKLVRMIRRDRSHPSLIIYNMHNERGAEPQWPDKEEMRTGHRLDETRIMTYNSSNGDIKMGPDARFKLHLLPYDTVFYDYGWFDQHHAGGPGTYHNNLYNGPENYLRYTDHRDEIIYYGEEGAIGTPPRLQLIKEAIEKRGKNIGWESAAYLQWYEAYDSFLKKYGFAKAFPNVDSLTRKMGNVAYYYQGRAIENIRINNTIDGYAINGWESMKLENHSGVVDNYRNLKGDGELIAAYNRPLYIAVKLNKKVLPAGDTTTADFFIVNETGIQGSFTLVVKASDENGRVLLEKRLPVQVSGGNRYGELLMAGLKIGPSSAGYGSVSAKLIRDDKLITAGRDEWFAVKLDSRDIPEGMVADTTGALQNFLRAAGVRSISNYKSGRPQGRYLLVGAFEPQQTGNPLVTDILEWVNEGNTLIIVNNAEHWADHLAKKEVLDYRGAKTLGTSWYGGNYFCRQHPLFNGLPSACVFNWEYQCFATYNRQRLGLRVLNGEPVVACVSDHKPEVYSALTIVRHGRGKIILCALDMLSCIQNVAAGQRQEGEGENAAIGTLNSSRQNPANIVGQQLLLNMMKLSGKN